MKRYRSALMAGLLALAVAVCDDDGTVVQPPPVVNVSPPDVTVTVPPAPPVVAPLQAMITPPAAEVGVDGMVDFAVGTSGGSGDASWTCTSSDVAVATVETTATGCRAMAVAGGGATITAAVTKGSESTNVAAQLTVSTTTDAFILVTDISGEGMTDASGLMGTVNVEVSVERGSQTFEKLSLNVDGMEVDAQDFGTAAADDAEQTVHTFTLSFDSDGYDEMGAVEYMNGEHSIQALLKIAGRDEALMSNVLLVDFDNEDGILVSLGGLGPGAMNSGTGQMWYGGPAAAALTITALPVLYSGGSVTSVGMGEFCGADAASASAPFMFMPDCEGTSNTMGTDEDPAGDTPAFTIDGEDIGILNAGMFPLYLDFDGPATSPYFSPNPNNREDGWLNAMVDFVGEQTDKNKDGFLTYNDEDDTGGVGGYMPVLRYAKADDDSVEDAIAAAPLSLMNFPGESKMDYYCGVVSAVDLLGNESRLPDKDDGECLTAGDAAVIADDGSVTTPATVDSYEELLEALRAANAADPVVEADVTAAQEALADAGILAGVDLTPPGIEIDEDMRINTGSPSMMFDVYDDEHDDHNSGLHSLPLLAAAQLRDTDDANCLDIGDGTGGTTAGAVATTDDDCDDPTALASGTTLDFSAPANAYYTVSGAARDKAGNYSAMASHTFVFDGAVATATQPAAPGSLEAGESFQVASFLNDDLSIRDYYVTANFAAVGAITARLGMVAPTMVDAFDADPLTHRNYSVTADIDTYAGLQDAATAGADAVSTLATVTVAVRDQADSDGTNDGTNSPALTVAAPDDGFDVAFTAALTSSEGRLCVAEDMDDCDDNDPATEDEETETELEVVATAAATGAFSNPFDRVDFWVQDVNGASWMLGSDTSGESDRVSSSDRRRTWTYSLDATVAEIYKRTREAGFPPSADSDDHTLLAFGVNDDGVALVMSVSIDIDDGEASQ